MKALGVFLLSLFVMVSAWYLAWSFIFIDFGWFLKLCHDTSGDGAIARTANLLMLAAILVLSVCISYDYEVNHVRR